MSNGKFTMASSLAFIAGHMNLLSLICIDYYYWVPLHCSLKYIWLI